MHYAMAGFGICYFTEAPPTGAHLYVNRKGLHHCTVWAGVETEESLSPWLTCVAFWLRDKCQHEARDQLPRPTCGCEDSLSDFLLVTTFTLTSHVLHLFLWTWCQLFISFTSIIFLNNDFSFFPTPLFQLLFPRSAFFFLCFFIHSLVFFSAEWDMTKY